MKKFYWINSKSLLVISISAVTLTIILVYFLGDGIFLHNAWISLTIITVAFFLFTSISLYQGIKVKDDIGDVTKNIQFKTKEWSSNIDLSGTDFGGLDDDGGIIGIIVTIILWIVIAIVAVFVLIFLTEVLIAMSIWGFAIFYWVFFRAQRMIFRHSYLTKRNISASLKYSVLYTALYSFWFYAILVAYQFLNY